MTALPTRGAAWPEARWHFGCATGKGSGRNVDNKDRLLRAYTMNRGRDDQQLTLVLLRKRSGFLPQLWWFVVVMVAKGKRKEEEKNRATEVVGLGRAVVA